VTKWQLYGAAIVILVIAWAAGVKSGAVATIGVVVIYLLSLRLHPRVRHTGFRGCGGSGERHGRLFAWTFRKCGRCESGRRIRFGAAHAGAGHIQAEAARTKAARAAAKDNGTWR
jgi:hypothetical protein